MQIIKAVIERDVSNFIMVHENFKIERQKNFTGVETLIWMEYSKISL